MAKTILFNDKNKHTCIIDYYKCWEDLRDQLKIYLEEKRGEDFQDKNGRYCIALAIDDLFEWMSIIEDRHKKYL